MKSRFEFSPKKHKTYIIAAKTPVSNLKETYTPEIIYKYYEINSPYIEICKKNDSFHGQQRQFHSKEAVVVGKVRDNANQRPTYIRKIGFGSYNSMLPYCTLRSIACTPAKFYNLSPRMERSIFKILVSIVTIAEGIYEIKLQCCKFITGINESRML